MNLQQQSTTNTPPPHDPNGDLHDLIPPKYTSAKQPANRNSTAVIIPYTISKLNTPIAS